MRELVQVRGHDGRVIGGYRYVPAHDLFLCESIHQIWPHAVYSEAEARRWLRETDRRRRPQGAWAKLKALLLRWSD